MATLNTCAITCLDGSGLTRTLSIPSPSAPFKKGGGLPSVGLGISRSMIRSNSGTPAPVSPETKHTGTRWPSPSRTKTAASLIGRRTADRAGGTGELLPSAPPVADLRLTFTGRLPLVAGLSYRASGEVITSSLSPYYAGPVVLDVARRASQGAGPDALRIPVDTFRFFVGLRYDFGAGSDAATGEAP